MGLHEWQRELGAMMSAPLDGPPTIVDTGLTVDERRWLLATTEDPGLRVTRHAQRSWRRMRLASALPVTMSALSREARARLIDAYLDAIPCISFFHTHEGRGFAKFLHLATDVDPHVLALADLEVAVANVLEYLTFAPELPSPIPLDEGTRFWMHPAATVITFVAAPERVLAAAITGSVLPPHEDTPYFVLVAPGLPNHARTLDHEELARVRACTTDAPPERSAWVQQLLAEGVLICR